MILTIAFVIAAVTGMVTLATEQMLSMRQIPYILRLLVAVALYIIGTLLFRMVLQA